MADQPQNKVLFIRVTEETFKRLDGATEEMGKKLGFKMTRSDLVRSLITKGLERMESDG
jgi:predicted DNA-binding protein